MRGARDRGPRKGRGRRGRGSESPGSYAGPSPTHSGSSTRSGTSRHGQDTRGHRGSACTGAISMLMESLKDGNDPTFQEFVLDQRNRRDADEIAGAARRMDLYSGVYGSGSQHAVVISKVPLPRYRPEFDRASSDSCIEMSNGTRQLVHGVLNTMESSPQGAMHGVQYISGAPVHAGLAQRSMHGSISSQRDLDQGKDLIENARLRKRQRELSKRKGVQKLKETRQKLPVFGMKDEILLSIDTNQVLVVSGDTGCGKTTQIPQFILENEIEREFGTFCNIICTQPRRISAVSIANRVSQEYGEDVGRTVGYQIRMDARKSQDTRLLFCTTGVLLRRLIQEPTLSDVSHVVVDEVHERGMNEDALLIVLKDLLQRRCDLKVILMSATMPIGLCQYFGNCPRIHIPGRSFPVARYFLEDTLQLTGITYFSRQRSQPPACDPAEWLLGWKPDAGDTDGKDPHVLVSLESWAGDARQTVNANFIAELVCWIVTHHPEGSILVFVPGFSDIQAVSKHIERHPVIQGKCRPWVLPLHSQLPPANQQKIFDPTPAGARKIIVATSIAETSITIEDVVFVIDSGKSKQVSYDTVNKLECMNPEWICRASAKQRCGRAGRVQGGQCFHLFPRRMHDEHLQEHLLPEILRMPLESIVLQIKSIPGVPSAREFLSKAVNPPEDKAIQNALDLLTALGALDTHESMTVLGQHLSQIPVDPWLAKMMILGAIFCCLDPILTIAAGVGYRDPFILSMERRAEADMSKREFADETMSDHIAISNAYVSWREAKWHGQDKNYCRENYLAPKTLEDISDMRLQFAELLAEQGFIKMSMKKYEDSTRNVQLFYNALEEQIRRLSGYRENLELVRAVICAGLYPKVVKVEKTNKKVMLKTVEDGPVELHRMSVLSADRNSLETRWLVYSSKRRTNRIFINSASAVSDYALLLFGGELTPVPGLSGSFTMMGARLGFKADKEAANLILRLRKQLQRVLQRKIEDPAIDVADIGGPIVQAIAELLEREAEPSDQPQREKNGSWDQEGLSAASSALQDIDLGFEGGGGGSLT